MLPQTRYLFQVQSLCSSLSCPVRPRGSPEEGCKDGTRGTEWPTGCETSLEAPGLKVPRLEPCQHYFSFSASCLSSHLIRVCLWPTGAWWHSNCAVKADTCRSSAHSPWGVLTRCGECSLTVGWAHTCTTSRGELPLRRRRWRLYILCLVFNTVRILDTYALPAEGGRRRSPWPCGMSSSLSIFQEMQLRSVLRFSEVWPG